jgi:hypothetical protein
MADRAQDKADQRYKEDGEHGVSPSTHLTQHTKLLLTSSPAMSSSSTTMRASFAANPRDSDKGFLAGKVWMSKYDGSTISCLVVPCPSKAFGSDEPYWTSQEVMS